MKIEQVAKIVRGQDGEQFAATLVQVIAVSFVQDATLWRSSTGADVRPL